MKNFILSLFLVLAIFIPSFVYAQTADQAAANAAIQGATSTGGSEAEAEERKKNQGVIDFFAKTVTKSVAQKTVDKITNAGLGLNILWAAFILFGFGLIIRDTGLGPQAFDQCIRLIISAYLVGCCINTNMYTGSPLQRLVTPADGTSGYLDVDVILYGKDLMDKAASEMWGADVRDKYEEARVQVFDALVTGKDAEKSAADKEEAKEGPKDTSMMGTAQWLLNLIQAFAMDPIKMLLEFLFKLLDIIYLAAMFLCMVLFSVQLGVSILLFKMIVVFGILPGFRDRVIAAYKVPASYMLFQFVNSLLLGICLIVYESLTAALAQIDTPTRASVALPLLAFAAFLVAAQIAAVFFIPRISRQLMDLSLAEVVNLGGTIAKAVMGLAGTALAALPAAGALISSVRGAATNAAGAAGHSARDFVNNRRASQGLSRLQGPISGTGRYPSPYGNDSDGSGSGPTGGSGGGIGSGGSGPGSSSPAGSTPASAPITPQSVKLDGAQNLTTSFGGTSALRKNRPQSSIDSIEKTSNNDGDPEKIDGNYGSLEQKVPDIDDSTPEQRNSSMAAPSGSALKKNTKNLKSDQEPSDGGDDDLQGVAEQRAKQRADDRAKRKAMRKAEASAPRTRLEKLKKAVLPKQKTLDRARFHAGTWAHALTSKQFLSTVGKAALLGIGGATLATLKAFGNDGDIGSVVAETAGHLKDATRITENDVKNYRVEQSGFGMFAQRFNKKEKLMSAEYLVAKGSDLIAEKLSESNVNHGSDESKEER